MPVESFLRCTALLPEPMLLVSAAEGTILAANRSVEKLGLDRGALEGRRLADWVAEEPERVAGYLRDCARSGQLVLGSFTVLAGEAKTACRSEGAVFKPRAGDEPALVLLRLLPKETAVHRFLVLKERIEALNREIARRKQAEEELQRQRQWLRVTLESIGDAVIATDVHGQVVFLNTVAESLIGQPQDAAIGRPLEEVFQIVNEETRKPVENPIRRVLRQGTAVGLANHTILLSRDGREIPIDDCASPIRGTEGNMLGAVMVFRDVSEQRSLRREILRRAERLAEADRRKDEFLAMLAHELRNPLAPIRNALEILTLPNASPATLRRAREMMSRQLQHLVRLVDDLLDISRITRGKVLLQKERVDLAELAARTAESLRPQADAKGVGFTVALPQQPILLAADPVRLEQVLFNLLHNGIKFTPAGERLWLSVSTEDGEAVVHVRDTGAGIPADLLPVVFEPFVQGDRSLERSHGGLGVGLTLVRSLVEMHGGSISASSEGEGRGSEFLVRLPLLERPTAGEPSVSGPSSGPDASRRVLIVDDNQDSVQSIEMLLGLWGHEARTAHDGGAALDAAAEFEPELVLLDIGLPGIDGYEVARRLRQRGYRGLLVALTGYGRDEDRERSREAGFDEHLVKPVDPASLRELLTPRPRS